jgi:type IV secretion system protein VirD4
VRPFLSDKYDLTQHPNYKLTGDYDKRKMFDIEKFLNRKMVLKPDEKYTVINMDA